MDEKIRRLNVNFHQFGASGSGTRIIHPYGVACEVSRLVCRRSGMGL